MEQIILRERALTHEVRELHTDADSVMRSADARRRLELRCRVTIRVRGSRPGVTTLKLIRN